MYTLLCGLVMLCTGSLISPATLHESIRTSPNTHTADARLAACCMLLSRPEMSSTLSKVLSILQDEVHALLLVKLFAAILTHG